MKAEIIFILDRSGSMASALADYIGGFNTFLEEQQQVPGACDVTLIQFDNEYLKTYDHQPLASIEPLTTKTFVPRGSTALYDAICRSIDEVGVRLSQTPESERPDKVMVVILTDGEENSSDQFSADDVRQRITHQREVYHWEFIFLAANQDAFANAATLGIPQLSTQSYVANAKGIQQAYASTGQTLRSLRTEK